MVTDYNLQLLLEYGGSKSLLLLGSQTMDAGGEYDYNYERGQQAVNQLYGAPFYNVVDVDNNGLALHEYDLTKVELGKFTAGVIADFGTTEHTSDPANVIRNVCSWLPVGGIGIFVNPSPDYTGSPAHKGLIRFTPAFWIAFCEAFGYEQLLVDTKPAYAGADTAIETRAVFKKVSGSKPPSKKKLKELIEKFTLTLDK